MPFASRPSRCSSSGPGSVMAILTLPRHATSPGLGQPSHIQEPLSSVASEPVHIFGITNDARNPNCRMDTRPVLWANSQHWYWYLVVPTSCSKTLHTPNLLRWDKVTSRWTWLMAGCGSACIAIFHLGTLTTSTPIKVGCVCWVLWRKPQDSLVELADHAGRKGFWVQHMVCNAATYLHPTPSSCNLQRGLIGRILADANHSVEGTHPQEWQHVTSLVLPARLTSPVLKYVVPVILSCGQKDSS